jgi:hypothetical protein
LLIWLGVPILGLSLLPYLVHLHYLLLTVPAAHVLVAWGIRPLWDYPPTRAIVIAFLVGFVSLSHFALNYYHTGWVAPHPTLGYAHLDGWSLESAAELGNHIRTLTADQPATPRLVTAANTPLVSGLSGKLLHTVQGVSYPDFVLLPGDVPLLYLFINQEYTAPTLGSEAEMAIAPYGLVDGTTVNIMRVPPNTAETAAALPQTPINWTSDTGLTFLGIDLTPTTPRQLHLTTYWRVEQLAVERDVWYITPFYHLVNGQGQIVVNEAPHGQWGYEWRLGDVYIQRLILTLPDEQPAGTYDLNIGLFDPVQQRPFNLNAPAEVRPFWHTEVVVPE